MGGGDLLRFIRIVQLNRLREFGWILGRETPSGDLLR